MIKLKKNRPKPLIVIEVKRKKKLKPPVTRPYAQQAPSSCFVIAKNTLGERIKVRILTGSCKYCDIKTILPYDCCISCLTPKCRLLLKRTDITAEDENGIEFQYDFDGIFAYDLKAKQKFINPEQYTVFRSGALIGEYVGDKYHADQSGFLVTDYVITVPGINKNIYYIDSLQKRCFISFINTHLDETKLNCEFVWDAANDKVFCKALKPIRHGEELYADYGSLYNLQPHMPIHYDDVRITTRF